MSRVYNFNAGPAALPLPVLETAQRELLDYNNTGMSIMEHSHRGKAYDAVHTEALSLARELMGIPDNYEVLLMQGGASAQFAMLPMNLLGPSQTAEYILTGSWSDKALAEAKTIGETRVVASTKEGGYVAVPKKGEVKSQKGAAYCHMTSNNTIKGTQWHYIPDVGDTPLLVDASSDIFSRPVDVSKHAVIYAGAQKNLGPSGVTMVIIRKDLVEKGNDKLPTIFQYRTFAEKNSLYNTPPTFAIYLVRTVLGWLKEQGGLAAMEKRNTKKAATLYGAMAESGGFYTCPVAEDSRSQMNVVFRLGSEDLESKFIAEATEAGMVGLKGHRSVGGCRASIYNATGQEALDRLATFMGDFKNKNS